MIFKRAQSGDMVLWKEGRITQKVVDGEYTYDIKGIFESSPTSKDMTQVIPRSLAEDKLGMVENLPQPFAGPAYKIRRLKPNMVALLDEKGIGRVYWYEELEL